MGNQTELLIRVIAIGIGATMTMDLWRLLLQKAFGISSLDLALLGRWVGHLREARFVHASIAKSPAIRGELILGWMSHYAIGIGFAGLLPLIWGAGWPQNPTLIPALAVGVATVLAPWFLMQPAMGLGFAARNTPAPNAVRLRNLAIHSVYGLGLFASAVLVQWISSTVSGCKLLTCLAY